MEPKLTKDMLANWLPYLLSNNNNNWVSQKRNKIENLKITKISGTINKVYEVTFEMNNKLTTLILKIYENNEIAEKEYFTLKTLKNKGIPVPKVYFLETNEKLLGAPFILMDKIQGKNIRDYMKSLGKNETLNVFEQLAETLAKLHTLNVRDFSFLEQPKSEYHYSKKQSLKEEIWAKNLIKDQKDYIRITDWLERNAHRVPCHRHSLLHRDMNPKNFLIDEKTKKIFVLDWTWAEIGDPLMDLGSIYYHLIFYLFDEKNREEIFPYFLKQYIKKTKLKINGFSLRFYLAAAGLREAMFLEYQAKKTLNPFYCAKIFGTKGFLFSPFISLHYRSRFKKVKRSLRQEIADYEMIMFETLGGKILSRMEIMDILKFLEPSSKKTILDVGTGSGRISRELLKKTEKTEIVGIDISKSNIESARARAKFSQNLRHYHFVLADGQYLPFKETTFDGIACIRTIKYCKNYAKAISEMSRVLKARGVLTIDFSSSLGYEAILRYITHSLSARGAHIFNFHKIKHILEHYKLITVDSVPLQKIPHKIWELSEDITLIKVLITAENILRKITPMVLSRSILVKCVKRV